jgi:glycosyltransferase involved in cell wall biosynthesis
VRIVMIGQRGVPATHGGIEHHVEEIGSRLADRGHDVTVFCRTNYVEEGRRRHRGMRIVRVPTIGTKHLDAIVHSGLSTFAGALQRADVHHFHALGPGLFTPVPRLLGRAKVVQTIHGLDHERSKWGGAAQQVLRTGAELSYRVPHAVVAVSRALAAHYRARSEVPVAYVPNGAPIARHRPPGPVLAELGLEPGRYVLFVGRLVPEKAPDALVRAFARLDTDQKLVIVGGSSFTDEYVASLEALAAADPRCVLAGWRFGDGLDELYSNAALFVLPSLLEGLPLTLLEAASFGLPVVASSIPPHLEVLGSSAPGRRLVEPGNVDALATELGRALADPAAELLGAKGLRAEVCDHYDWDLVTDATEDLYHRVLEGRPLGRPGTLYDNVVLRRRPETSDLTERIGAAVGTDSSIGSGSWGAHFGSAVPTHAEVLLAASAVA